MIVLGIDPGTATTGWGVIEEKNKRQRFIDCGVITTPAKLKDTERLLIIYGDLNILLKKYKPDVLALEMLFFNTNAKTAMLVGQARGVVMLTASLKKIPLFSYTPLQVKMAITGYGRADKKQIQEMVKNLVKLSQIPKPDDAADALAVALTHCYSTKLYNSYKF